GSGPAAETFTQGADRVPGAQADGDLFGYALAAGLTRAGAAFLIIGAPGDDVNGSSDAGTVTYLRDDYRIAFDQAVVPSQVAEQDDRGGYALAATPDHFAVGYPGQSRNAATPFAGAVCVFSHTIANNKPGVIGCYDQDSAGISDTAEAGDAFGTSISMA